MVEYLIAKGADINKAGALWSTPLKWATNKEYRFKGTIAVKESRFEGGGKLFELK